MRVLSKAITGNTVAPSVSDYIKHLTPHPLKSIHISPISLSIIPGEKKKNVLKIFILYGMA